MNTLIYKHFPASIRRIALMMLCSLLAVSAHSQEGSWGNTYIGSGGAATFFGPHSFVTGGSGTQPGLIKTERAAPFGILYYGPDASYTGADDASHVDGYVGKAGTTAFVFPVGNGIKLRPAGISAPAASGIFKAAYWFANPNSATLPAGAPFPTANTGTGVTTVSDKEYWDIDGASAVDLTLTWDAASALNVLTGGVLENLIIVGYSTGTNKWESVGGIATGVLTGIGSITATGVTPDNYSAFTFATEEAPEVPDLTVMVETGNPIIGVGSSSAIDVYIENITSYATAGEVKVTILKPSSSSGLTLTIDPGADWTKTETTTLITLTLVGVINGFDYKTFSGTLSRTGGSAGTYNFSPIITAGSGGETNSQNNRALVTFTKN